MKHLSDLEQRLQQASDEVRRVAAHSVPPLIEEKSRPLHRGWIVFAAAFGAVVIAVGVLPMLSRSGEPDVVGEPSPSTTHAITSSTLPAATTSTPVTADCSGAGLPQPADQEGLPAPVAEARRAMATAAVTCDFEALEALAASDLNTSFGGGGFANIPRWEEDDTYPALELMVKLFDTPYAVQEFEGLPRYYVWPSAFVYDTWEEVPPADLEALLTVYTQEELDRYSGFGAYALWRIGITEDGTWKFFVAGD